MLSPKMSIAVVGASVAGAWFARLAAGQGHRVTLLDPRTPWEKPCGGGLTTKLLRDFPEIAGLDLAGRAHRGLEIVFPSGPRSSLTLPWPIVVASRKRLGENLLDLARAAGAEFLPERVQELEQKAGRFRLRTSARELTPELVVGADGATSLVRRRVAARIPREDLCLTLSALLPGEFGLPLTVKFFRGFHGYAWIFPRQSETSVGIAMERGGAGRSELTHKLTSLVQEEWTRGGLTPPALPAFRAWYLPALKRESFLHPPRCGPGWALVGDAAGAADPLTGEGIYYALKSAQLLADALAAGDLGSYAASFRAMAAASIGKVAKVTAKFYHPLTLRFLAACLQLSPSARALTRELLAGFQPYDTLKRRVFVNAPVYAAEMAGSLLTGRRGEDERERRKMKNPEWRNE